MAAIHKSTGASDQPHPNATPLYQAIVLVRCSEHGDHTLLLTSRDDEELINTADFIATAMQTAGLTVIVQHHKSNRALEDLNMRHIGFGETCDAMKRASEHGVGIFYSAHEADVELPF